MNGIEGLSRGKSVTDLFVNGFKDKIDSGSSSLTQSRQQSQFQNDLDGSVSMQIQNNDHITEEMNKLNLDMAKCQVVKKMGENAKSLTQGG
ncbi:hypothetical protein VB151_05585 [Xanthomonas fragariae]|uniref:HrpE protein n=1 Tax=Xanthomonas fragariae TaxID=48664 RepID=A0A1Y6GXD7_9XANT|nr:hypothetical protein [Xanthomonas fragariae]AOD15471.1 hypothetical protein BER92_12955 [Xanthomonas fragariae]AOD18878.1 hypothetical protein BER93_12980 [Xanthomonas fragariae]ENZ96819.1 hypothetical protein O1K_02571 [Xanthomonas fragariae LMG 25863]MBL9196557.1 hypothetical protein [Xanthomonas fragariae]MBL9221551.1 hypothetical protein [Xanthomonas fragariae]